MYLHLLSFLFICEALFSCGLNQEKIQRTEATLGSPSNEIFLQPAEKEATGATKLVFQSNDLGQHWTDVSAGLPDSLGIVRVLADGGEIVLASGNKLYRRNTSTQGLKWEKEVLPSVDILQNLEITGLFQGKTGLFASSYEKGLFKEIPGLHLWTPIDRALKDKSVRCVLETSDGALFVGVESGLFKSLDGGASWKQVVANMGINSLVAADAEEKVLIAGTYEGLRRSTDGGEHWDLVLTEDYSAWHTQRIEGGLITITDGDTWKNPDRSNRLRLSTDNGKTWQRIDEGLAQVPFMSTTAESGSSSKRIYSFAQAGKFLFCCTNAGIFRSGDLGKNWELVRLSNEKEMFELIVSGNVVYAIQVVGC